MGNYFRPRATLKAIKANLMLQKLVLAGRMWPARRMLPPPVLGHTIVNLSTVTSFKDTFVFYNCDKIRNDKFFSIVNDYKLSKVGKKTFFATKTKNRH